MRILKNGFPKMAACISSADEYHYLQGEFLQWLAETPEVFRFITPSRLDGAWVWDLEHPENKWLGPHFWQVLGYDPASMQHSSIGWRALVYEEDIALLESSLAAHWADPTSPFDQTLRFYHANGAIKRIHSRGMAIKNKAGKPTRMVGFYLDVTPGIGALEASRRHKVMPSVSTSPIGAREKELQFVLDSVSSLVWLLNIDESIIMMNKQAKAFLGVSPESSGNIEAIKTLLADGSDARGEELSCFDAGGARTWLRVDRTHLELAHGEPRILIVANDITGVKHREARLEKLNRSLKEFADVTAHDLQAPLRQTSMFVDMLVEELDRERDTLSGDAKDALRGVVQGIVRMRRIVKSLYDLSRLETVEVTFSTVDLRQVLTQAIAQAGEGAEDETISIRLDNVPLIRGAADLLTQVLQNLISNARKYRSARPLVITVEHEQSTDGLHHYVRVRDNGSGVAPDQQQLVFRPYKRLKRDENAPGAGIGLALCQRIMSLHNGRIFIEEGYSDGACFVLEFPMGGARRVHIDCR